MSGDGTTGSAPQLASSTPADPEGTRRVSPLQVALRVALVALGVVLVVVFRHRIAE